MLTKRLQASLVSIVLRILIELTVHNYMAILGNDYNPEILPGFQLGLCPVPLSANRSTVWDKFGKLIHPAHLPETLTPVTYVRVSANIKLHLKKEGPKTPSSCLCSPFPL